MGERIRSPSYGGTLNPSPLLSLFYPIDHFCSSFSGKKEVLSFVFPFPFLERHFPFQFFLPLHHWPAFFHKYFSSSPLSGGQATRPPPPPVSPFVQLSLVNFFFARAPPPSFSAFFCFCDVNSHSFFFFLGPLSRVRGDLFSASSSPGSSLLRLFFFFSYKPK